MSPRQAVALEESQVTVRRLQDELAESQTSLSALMTEHRNLEEVSEQQQVKNTELVERMGEMDTMTAELKDGIQQLSASIKVRI